MIRENLRAFPPRRPHRLIRGWGSIPTMKRAQACECDRAGLGTRVPVGEQPSKYGNWVRLLTKRGAAVKPSSGASIRQREHERPRDIIRVSPNGRRVRRSVLTCQDARLSSSIAPCQLVICDENSAIGLQADAQSEHPLVRC